MLKRKIKRQTIYTERPCWLYHDWRMVKQSGCNTYFECNGCDSRRVNSVAKNHPLQTGEVIIDRKWMLVASDGDDVITNRLAAGGLDRLLVNMTAIGVLFGSIMLGCVLYLSDCTVNKNCVELYSGTPIEE